MGRRSVEGILLEMLAPVLPTLEPAQVQYYFIMRLLFGAIITYRMGVTLLVVDNPATVVELKMAAIEELLFDLGARTLYA
jgi:hypothetical protein